MPTSIDRDDIRRLVDGGAQLVEVLPAKEYEETHLPGAINIPLKRLPAMDHSLHGNLLQRGSW